MPYDPTTYNLEANTDMQDIWDTAVTNGNSIVIVIQDRAEAFRYQMDLYRWRKAYVTQIRARAEDNDDRLEIEEVLAPYQTLQVSITDEGNLRIGPPPQRDYPVIDEKTGDNL